MSAEPEETLDPADEVEETAQTITSEEAVREIIDKCYAPVVEAMKQLISSQTALISKMVRAGMFSLASSLEIATLNAQVAKDIMTLREIGEKKTAQPKEDEVIE